MNRVDLFITAESPLALGRRRPGGSISEVETYIPGSVLRGAIASQILQQANQSNDQPQSGDFETLFLGDTAAIFQNAYPAIAQVGTDEWSIVNDTVRVLPATAVSSKTNPGFRSAEKGGVFDTLIDSFCRDQVQQPYEFTDPSATGEGANSQVEPYSAFYSITNQQYCKHEVSSRFLTRVGINRRRATAEEQVLYSVAVLNESFAERPKAARYEHQRWRNVVYRSTVLVEDTDLAIAFVDFINREPQSFRIGGSTSRGLGKVQIKAIAGTAPDSLETRVKQFNQALEKRMSLWTIFGEHDTDLSRMYFTIDLQSDAILNENWQRTTMISAEMLEQFAGIANSSLSLHRAYSSYDYRSGWNAAWELMKDVELVTNRGAVYLFSVDSVEYQRWLEALKKLEEKGVGDRTVEGFGQVRICDEFHETFREKAA
ncbi:CRISPR-associated RAMP protein Csx10 [Pseudanabaenaceae cyanobacterium LEGE 13415]|nr:CRISPR-associated RAMP protein Csx10 [Pseudanabaenaceae cyanobacterium LEGE 13415]